MEIVFVILAVGLLVVLPLLFVVFMVGGFVYMMLKAITGAKGSRPNTGRPA